MKNNRIICIYVDNFGKIYSTPDEPIEMFQVNGEMASVNWFSKGNEAYNGKYVIYVKWEETL